MPKAKAVPKVATWKVVGGASSGGLVVRSSAKVSSEECEKRLATGSLVQELELAGERLRFRLLSGGGPQTGWVSTKFKGKDLVARCPLKVGLLCTGSRGDIQPLIALGVGMQRAGCEVTIFGHVDFADYVTDVGLRFEGMLDPIQEEDSKKDEDSKEDEDVIDGEKVQLFFARFAASTFHKCPVGGVSAKEDVPQEIMAYGSDHCLHLLGHCVEIAQSRGDAAAVLEHLTKQIEAVIAIKEAAAQQFAVAIANKEAAIDGAGNGPGDDAQAAPGSETALPAPEPASGRGAAAEATPSGQATSSPDLPDVWSGEVAKFRDNPLEGSLFGISSAKFASYLSDPENKRLFEILENDPPDVMLFHWGMGQGIGVALDAKFGIPSIPYNLYSNVCPGDPRGSWMTEGTWQLVRTLTDSERHLETLEQAREEHAARGIQTDCTSYELFRILLALDMALIEPLLGVSALRHLGWKRYAKRIDEGNIVGFLSSVASKQVLSFFGEQSREKATKHTFVGFWTMDPDDQTTGADMFGGQQVLDELEAFLDAGPKPVYMGWGSMADFSKGVHSMVLLAVTALKELGMRGIVLGGWAKLSYKMLEEAVGPNDEAGLCEYARKNVLFAMKAPQMWLFPKCAAIVIHGGSGTLAAAWTSGVPVIVVPVTVDQPSNGLLNMAMMAGLCTRDLGRVTATELSNAVRTVLASPEIQRGAQVVQIGMMRDQPIQKALEAILNFMAEEAISNPRKSTKAMAREIFERFDEDRDGFLNEQELSNMLRTCCPEVEGMDVERMTSLCCSGYEELPSETDLQRGVSKEHIIRMYDDPKCRRALDSFAPDVFIHHALTFGGWRMDEDAMAAMIFDRFDEDKDGVWNMSEVWAWLSTVAKMPMPWEYIEHEVYPKLMYVAHFSGSGGQPRAVEGMPRGAVTSLYNDPVQQMRFGSPFPLREHFETVFEASGAAT